MSQVADAINALGGLFASNPTGATSVMNVLGHQNGQAATMAMALLSMATPDNIGDIAQQIARIPGVGNLNILPLVQQLIGIKDQSAFQRGILAVENALTTSHSSGFGGIMGNLFSMKKKAEAAKGGETAKA